MGDGATMDNNNLRPGANASSLTIGVSSRYDYNDIGINATVDTLSVGDSGLFYNNQIDTGGSFNLSSVGAEGAIQNNVVNGSCELVSVGARTFFDANQLIRSSVYDFSVGDDSAVRANFMFASDVTYISAGNNVNINVNNLNVALISNKTFEDNSGLSAKSISLTVDAAETISANVEGNRAGPGISDIPGTIDITGLTTLDCTAAFAQYRGIYNLTSSNATESIDTITSPPTLFPFTIRPAAGLVLTITGTAYAGIAAGQIALKAASYVLDGDKGEYIVLEIDPLGTGCLVEKYVGNGLI